jgi:hypothetical protein
MPEKKKSPYQFYGAPMYDPRKENRIFLKASGDQMADASKISSFVYAAILKNATTIEIRDPTRSGKEGQYELYSDASIDSKTFHAALNLKRGKKDAGKS